MEQLPHFGILIAGAQHRPHREAPLTNIPPAHNFPQVPGDRAEIRRLSWLQDPRPAQFSETCDQQSGMNGNPRPVPRNRLRSSPPKETCKGPQQRFLRPGRCVPAFQHHGFLPQIPQANRAFSHAQLHIGPGDLRIKQSIQHIRRTGVEGEVQNRFLPFPGKGNLSRKKQSPIRRKLPGQRPLRQEGLSRISCGYVQQSASLPWRCSRKYPLPFLPPRPASAAAAPWRDSFQSP